MTAASLESRIVVATLLTATVASAVLAGTSIFALRFLLRRNDERELARTAETLERSMTIEIGEMVHTLPEAAREVLEQVPGPSDVAEIRWGGNVVAVRGKGPRLGPRGELPSGWIGTRREMPGEIVLEVVRRRGTGPPLRQLFWAALLVASVPSLLAALAAGRWAARAAAKPIEDLCLRLAAVDRPGDYVPAEAGTLAREAAVLEDAFTEVLGRLGHALEREAAFARDAAHELRTPLTRIRLRAERLASLAAPPDRQELEGLVVEVDRLTRLVDALLVLARDETGGLGAAETVNLADVVRVSAQEGERTVDVAAPDEALVRGDADLLRLAVDNLLDNARKYAPGGLVPSVSLRSDPEGVTLAVLTPGVVLEEPERALVFERFYRGAAARDTASGHGLGLALARHVARLHGGDVVAAEGRREDTLFELRLPPWRGEA